MNPVDRCSRCGITITNPVGHCPGCGAALAAITATEQEPNYYAIFELSPQMSCSEIRARLDQAARVWGRRATGSAKMEQRHEAERMVQYLSAAEDILLTPSRRAAYDLRWGQRQSDNHHQSRQTTRPDRRVEIPTHSESGPATRPGGNSATAQTTNWIGWTTVRGIVIHIEPLYTIPPPIDWFRVVLAILLFPVMIFIAMAVLSVWIASRIMFPRFMGGMDISNVLILLCTFRRIGEQRPQVPVRDLRLRDSKRNEHSVRLVGQLIGSSVNMGDDVTLSGFSRCGTIKARRGINHRTRSVIVVRV